VDVFAERLLQLLSFYGPGLLFLFAMLETCFVAGFVVESGLATAIGTVLALEGRLDLGTVVASAALGGAAGDSIGFWIGRAAGERVLKGEGRFGRALARRNARWSRFFDQNLLISVTLARVVPFARSAMPMGAGMSAISYRRYLPFELLGVAAWVAVYVGLGILGRQSWEMATQLVGFGGAFALAAAGLALWWMLRRRHADAEAPGS
jgi:uncharacterized protein (TIGR03382 family)